MINNYCQDYYPRTNLKSYKLLIIIIKQLSFSNSVRMKFKKLIIIQQVSQTRCECIAPILASHIILTWNLDASSINRDENEFLVVLVYLLNRRWDSGRIDGDPVAEPGIGQLKTRHNRLYSRHSICAWCKTNRAGTRIFQASRQRRYISEQQQVGRKSGKQTQKDITGQQQQQHAGSSSIRGSMGSIRGSISSMQQVAAAERACSSRIPADAATAATIIVAPTAKAATAT